MLPINVLFTVFGVPIYAHGFFLTLGLLVGVAWLVIESRRRHWPKEEVVPMRWRPLWAG